MVDLRNTPRSRPINIGKRKPLSFPIRSDYVDHLIEVGVASSEEEVVTSSATVIRIYLDWMRRGQIGCVFAQKFAREHNRGHFDTRVLYPDGTRSPFQTMAAESKTIVDDAVSNPDCEAVSLIYPTIDSNDDLIELIRSLADLSGWWLAPVGRRWRGTLRLVKLRVYIAPDVSAEVLGMGPFELFPTTRKSPFTSLEIRVKPLRARISQERRPERRAHLADITDHSVVPASKIKNLTMLTEQWKRRILGGEDDQRAKAKVTVSVPAPLWDAATGDG